MWGESYRVLATGLDNQSVCLQIDPAAFASFSAWEEVSVVAGQHTGSEHHEHLAVSCQEEYWRTGATSLHTGQASM